MSTEIILKRNEEAVIKAFGLEDFPREEQREVLDKIFSHFNKVILETFLLRLSDEKAEELKQLLAANRPSLYEEVTLLASRTPQLSEALEEAVANEFAVLKTVFKK